ncbi:hypothetical protein COO60DRAFT_602486 [Scenedesmus sp. NREL 46B-D3]|nr:hypothetical protein COO60DRAFT_602486 [Scenedesmus sp. NREL 46B-D3]
MLLNSMLTLHACLSCKVTRATMRSTHNISACSKLPYSVRKAQCCHCDNRGSTPLFWCHYYVASHYVANHYVAKQAKHRTNTPSLLFAEALHSSATLHRSVMRASVPGPLATFLHLPWPPAAEDGEPAACDALRRCRTHSWQLQVRWCLPPRPTDAELPARGYERHLPVGVACRRGMCLAEHHAFPASLGPRCLRRPTITAGDAEQRAP